MEAALDFSVPGRPAGVAPERGVIINFRKSAFVIFRRLALEKFSVSFLASPPRFGLSSAETDCYLLSKTSSPNFD